MPHSDSNIRSIGKPLPAMFQAVEGHQEVVWRIQEADLRKEIEQAKVRGAAHWPLGASASCEIRWNKYHQQGPNWIIKLETEVETGWSLPHEDKLSPTKTQESSRVDVESLCSLQSFHWNFPNFPRLFWPQRWANLVRQIDLLSATKTMQWVPNGVKMMQRCIYTIHIHSPSKHSTSETEAFCGSPAHGYGG